MQSKSLSMRRALSAALFVLLLVVVGSKNALAQNQVATLQHNDTITGVFYGQNAFVSAHNAAVNGDIITLSSGTFNNCTISKSITIRGAGCTYDSVSQVTPTIIPGDFDLQSNSISFEGIWFTGIIKSWDTGNNNISFLKCHINRIGNFYYPGVRMNWQIINCIVKDIAMGGCSIHGMSIINSVVRFTRYDHTDLYNPTTLNNSIVLFDNGQPIKNIVAYNTVFSTVSEHEVTNCTFFNCIGIETGETLLFEGQTAQNVMEVDSYEDVFETFDGTVTFDNSYQLKNDIATSFLGQDGTEVGIYGGMIPYRTRPNYMIIKNINVAGRTTEDNKLNVEIELLNAGE